MGTRAPLKKRAFSFQEAAEVAELSRASLYRAVDAGHLKVVQIGNRKLIKTTELAAYLMGKTMNDREHVA